MKEKIPEALIILRKSTSKPNWVKIRRFLHKYLDRLSSIQDNKHKSFFSNIMYDTVKDGVDWIEFREESTMPIKNIRTFLKNVVLSIRNSKEKKLTAIYTFVTEKY